MLWFVRSAIVALFPRVERDGVVIPGAADCGLDEFLKRFKAETTTLVWLGTVLGAFVFHFTPLLTIFVPLPAFLLPKGLLDRHAAGITTTSIYLLRQAVFLVKLPGGLCWGADPQVRKLIALPPLGTDPGTWRAAG
ncbi:MAG: hypothetical protein JNJ54_26750 [Myxococcaceae bacterium]|nr:hypothetical protein [Myxococcaceae bacterium]